jgi:hypothetical protein
MGSAQFLLSSTPATGCLPRLPVIHTPWVISTALGSSLKQVCVYRCRCTVLSIASYWYLDAIRKLSLGFFVAKGKLNFAVVDPPKLPRDYMHTRNTWGTGWRRKKKRTLLMPCRQKIFQGAASYLEWTFLILISTITEPGQPASGEIVQTSLESATVKDPGPDTILSCWVGLTLSIVPQRTLT